MCVYSLESPGLSLFAYVRMSTHNIHFHDKIRNILLIFIFLKYRKNFLRTPKQLRISYGKRAIGVRVIEDLLYM